MNDNELLEVLEKKEASKGKMKWLALFATVFNFGGLIYAFYMKRFHFLKMLNEDKDIEVSNLVLQMVFQDTFTIFFIMFLILTVLFLSSTMSLWSKSAERMAIIEILKNKNNT